MYVANPQQGNIREQVMIRFCFTWQSGVSFLSQSLRVVMQKQRKYRFLSTLKWKPLSLKPLMEQDMHYLLCGRELIYIFICKSNVNEVLNM